MSSRKRSLKLNPEVMPAIAGLSRFRSRLRAGSGTVANSEALAKFHLHDDTGPDPHLASQSQSRSISLWLSLCNDLPMEAISSAYLRQENVPNSAPAAIPTAKPIMKPIFTLSKQLGCDCPYGPTVTGI